MMDKRAVRPATRLAAGLLVAGLGAALVVGCGDGGGRDGGGDALSSLDPDARRGRQIASDRGCTSCHTADGSESTGPTWERIWGTTVELDGGGTATVDRAYVVRSIRDPDAQVVDGYAPIMPSLDLTDAEIDALVAYLEALG
jgi:cytochrome c oxidase subunit 2